MDLLQMSAAIYDALLQFVPLFRGVWVAAILCGLAMVTLAFVLKKNPVRKKAPWIVGGIGCLMVICSGSQLIMSLCSEVPLW